MSSPIKQDFTVLLAFSESLVTKCVSLKDESCMVTPQKHKHYCKC